MKILWCMVLCSVSWILGAQAVIEGAFQRANGGNLPEKWKVTAGKGSSVTVVDAAFEQYKKAVQLPSPVKGDTEVTFLDPLPAKKGDTLLVEVVFKTSRGQKVAFGVRSVTGKEMIQRKDSAYSSSWDRRTVTIRIQDPSTKAVRAFVRTSGGKSPVLFSYILVKRLSTEMADLYSREKSVAKFRAMTQGNNLARKGKILFYPRPSYELTVKKGTDATDLIDGKVSTMNAIWFDPAAVGFEKAYNGASITVDLGKLCNVEKAVIRLQGGRIHSYSIGFPDVLEIWISKDGKNYFPASSMTKVKATESSMANWKDLYYLPESENSSGIPYVYPFEMPVMAQARYVMFRCPVYRLRMLFSDELAVMEASASRQKSPEWNSAYKKSPRYMNHGSIMIYPKMESFYVGEGIKLPNFLTVENLIRNPKGKFSYEMDFPAVVKFTPDGGWPAQTRILEKTVKSRSRVTYRFRSGDPLHKFLEQVKHGFGPFYFYVENGVKIPAGEEYVIFRTFYNGKEALSVKRPLVTLKIPEIRPPEKLDISMWWEERFMGQTDHVETFRKCGFTASMFFPRSPWDSRHHKKLYDRAFRKNFKVRLELEPTSRLRWRYPKVTQYRCVGAEKDPWSICLAYRGEYYQKSLAEIKNILKTQAVDAVTFDIESWEPRHLNISMRCTRCKALKEKKGYRNWIEYLEKEQASFVKAYADAVREGAKEGGHKIPSVGFYALSPTMYYVCAEGKVSFLGYKYLYPAHSDEIQYSYYGRSSAECHKQMRRVFKQTPFNARRIPWLSAGTGAYYTTPYSRRNEQQVLETLMNGATGIQFYSRKSFESPLDYYFVAKGIGALSPYEDFLFKGTLEEQIKGDNKALCYTVRRLGKDYLCLVGNYESRTVRDCSISMPGTVRSVKKISGEGSVSAKGNTLSIRIGADSFVLLKVSL